MTDFDSIPGLTSLREVTLGTRDVSIALLDGPVDLDHPCFEGVDLHRIDPAWLTEPVNGEETHWLSYHATGIASILCGQRGSSVEGVAPGIRVIAITCAKAERDAIDELVVVRAIETALDLGVDIIHCAYCLPSLTSSVGDLLRSALLKADQAGVLVVAPSGNNSSECACAPADQPTVLAVGALDFDNRPRTRSNDGPAYLGHGVMTVGTDIDIAVSPDSSEKQHGTSCAAPIATGVCALLLGLSRERNLNLQSTDIGRILIESAQMPPAEGAADGWIGGVLSVDASCRRIFGSIPLEASSAGIGQSSLASAGPTIMYPSRLFALGGLTVQAVDDAAFERLERLMVGGNSPNDPQALIELLDGEASARDLVHWILTVGEQPTWIIRGLGAFADDVSERLLLIARTTQDLRGGPSSVDHVSLAGFATNDSIQLRNGGSARVAYSTIPESINAWNDRELVVSALSGMFGVEPSAEQIDELFGVVQKIGNEMINDRTHGRDRALNQVVTNLYQLALVTMQGMDEGREFARVRVQKSRFDRTSSDCWDIVVELRDRVRSNRASRQWVWTIDVAGDRPVSVGTARSWLIPG